MSGTILSFTCMPHVAPRRIRRLSEAVQKRARHYYCTTMAMLADKQEQSHTGKQLLDLLQGNVLSEITARRLSSGQKNKKSESL